MELNRKLELATEIRLKNSNFTEKLTYVGSGTTCIVYQTESKDIVKEFAPCIRIGNQLVETMSRKQAANDKLTPLNTLTSFDLSVLEERRAAFDSEMIIIDELNSRYRDDEDNMFLVPRDMPETSLGRCHWCNYVGGQTLQDVFEESRKNNDFQTHFLNVLPLIISLYDEIAFYHCDDTKDSKGNGILNLDIKPENLFAVRSQGTYIGVRNLDFGSAKRIDDKMSGEKRTELGLISSICSCTADKAKTKLSVDQIGAKLFASSPVFYDQERIKSIIENCLESKRTREDIVSDLKLLDIAAAWKTFLWAFVDSKDCFAPLYPGEIERYIIKRIFEDIFETNHLTLHHSLFESYHIYLELFEITHYIFMGKRRSRLTASEIATRLRNILCILGGIPDNKKTDEQRYFEAMNDAFSQKDELLSSYGLNSIKDILDFCKSNGLKQPEKPRELYWFFMFGDKHESHFKENI